MKQVTKEEFLEEIPAEQRRRFHFVPSFDGGLKVPVTQASLWNDDDFVVAVDDRNTLVGWTYVKDLKQGLIAI